MYVETLTLTFWVVLTLVYKHSLLGNSGDRSVLSYIIKSYPVIFISYLTIFIVFTLPFYCVYGQISARKNYYYN